LVLRSPVTRSPGFHSPRFLSKSTRSKRFKTLRFAPRVEAARRLRCCDIKLIDSIQPALPGRVLARRRHPAAGREAIPQKRDYHSPIRLTTMPLPAGRWQHATHTGKADGVCSIASPECKRYFTETEQWGFRKPASRSGDGLVPAKQVVC
jgi:hypothetical protein